MQETERLREKNENECNNTGQKKENESEND